jgi:ribonuclease Z
MKGEVPHSNWSIRCVSTPGPDTDLSIYVSFEKARFLFGCGQGSQRAFVQKRLSMRGLGAVFLPGGTEEGRGGVAGMSHSDRRELMIGTIMTAADAGIKELSIVGPPDTSHFLATLRTAVQR